MHEHIPRISASAYSTSKAGLALLTNVIAMELAPHGIRVNGIAPDEIATPTLIWYMICFPHYLRPRFFLRARSCTLLRTVQVLQLGGRIEACAFENF